MRERGSQLMAHVGDELRLGGKLTETRAPKTTNRVPSRVAFKRKE
jgi:hypothetical protein